MRILQFSIASLKSADSIRVWSLDGVQPKTSVPVAFILAARLFASLISSSDATESVRPLNKGPPHSLIEKSKEKVVTAVRTCPLSAIACIRMLSGTAVT